MERGVKEFGLDFTNPVKTRGVLDVCQCEGWDGVISV